MDVSGISGVSGYLPPLSAPAVQPQTSVAPGTATGAAAASPTVTTTNVSSTSMASSTETFLATYGPALSNKDLLGAVLLMLTLDYLKGDKDEQEKKDILALMMSLLQQQATSNQAGTLMYSASSMSMETMQLQSVCVDSGIGAYSGAGVNPQVAPSVDAGSAGLDVMA